MLIPPEKMITRWAVPPIPIDLQSYNHHQALMEAMAPPEPPRLMPWPRKDGQFNGDYVWHRIFTPPTLLVNSPVPDSVTMDRCRTILPDHPRDYPYWHHLPCPCGRVVWKLK